MPKQMADLFRNIQTSFPNLGETVRAAGSGFNSVSLLYIALAALVVFFIVLMILNKPIDFSWLDPRPKSMKATDDAYLFWKPSAIFTNLVVKENSVPGFINNVYTVIFDGLLLDSRNYKNGGPWRQIVHRGSSELAATTIGGAALSGCSARPSNMTTLPNDGLPRRMNPGIFLDPNTNDIVIFIDCEKGSETIRESIRLTDIPMDIPFRIGVLINGHLLEVYLNCKLEASKILGGRPMSVENIWYGLSGSAAAVAQIQNMYIWKRALPADLIGAVCGAAPPKFDKIRPICDRSADARIESGPAAQNTTANIAVSYGNSLSACAASV